MFAYVYYDFYQDEIGKEILDNLTHAEALNSDSRFESCDFRKLPTVLIILSQPNLEVLERIYQLPWSFVLVYKGVRYDAVASYFDTYEQLFDCLKVKNEAFMHEMIQLHETMHKEIEKPVMAKTPNDSWRGLYAYCGNPLGLKNIMQAYSKEHKNQKILLLDGDLIKPSFDKLFEVPTFFTKVESHLKGIDNTGFNILYDSVYKNAPIESIVECIAHKHSSGFYYILGNYNWFNYEHYQEDVLQRMINLLKQQFDIVIVNVNKYISDTFSLLVYCLSNKIIFYTDDTIEDIRYYKNLMDLLNLRQTISLESFHVIVESNNKLKNVLFSTFKSVFGKQLTMVISPRSNLKTFKKICKNIS